ncbi:hypothetical protein SDC9_185299 [bioreactor metagenome]|uniref:Uncharacterized protein n=1 Tax=bioreactor metagenome TaxID=1076179 RepID=A0A645HFH3_9ZZZZ
MNGSVIMSVYIHYIPMKTSEFIAEAFNLIDLAHISVQLRFVVIHKKNQVFQLALSCKHNCLPVLALL